MSEKKGLFGILKEWVSVSEEEKSQHNYAISKEKENTATGKQFQVTEEIESFCVTKLEELLELSGFQGKISTKSKDGHRLYLDIFESGDDVGRIIGKSGGTLDAFQTLLRHFVIRKFQVPIRVVIDAGEYRNRRYATVKEKAMEAANGLANSGDKVELNPMSAAERRVVHMLFENDDAISTDSEGAGSRRRIILIKN